MFLKPQINLFETQITKVVDITDINLALTTNSDIPKIINNDINLTMTKDSKI